MIKFSIPSVVFNELSEVARRARVARGRFLRRNEPLERAKDYMVQRWDVNFSGQGSIYGDWPSLNESWTVAERGSSSPILVRTGGLWTHFTSQNEDGTVDGQNVIWQFSNGDGAFTVTMMDILTLL